MKILLVSDYYPPVLGGVARHVYLLARALSHRGHDVRVFTPASNSVLKETSSEGFKVSVGAGFFQRLPFLFRDSKIRHHPPIQDLIITKMLGKIIKTEKPDVIHVHGWILNSVLPLRKTYGIPIVSTIHDYGLLCPNKVLLKENKICEAPYHFQCLTCSVRSFGAIKAFFSTFGVKLAHKSVGQVDRFIAVSTFVKGIHLRYLPLHEEDIVVIPNFYVKEKLFNGGLSSDLPEDFILFVGALLPTKGVETLMEAYKQIDSDSKLVIMGRNVPPYKYGSSENILVFRDAPRSQVLQGILHSKLLVVPSIWPETFGQVALEGMAFKKAVIASKIGGLEDIVCHNETGLLVPPGDIEALKRSLVFLLKNPSIAEEMGSKGYRRFTDCFSEEKVVPMIERVYEDAIARGVG